MKVVILLGGLIGVDGYATSGGLIDLGKRIEAMGHEVSTYTWPYWNYAVKENADVVIGYSGGGSRATWLAQASNHDIKLMVLYDPSPASSMAYIRDNVKKTIVYYNTAPWMLGLGGGIARGHNIETVPIAQQHLAVQYNQDLHNRTIEAIKELT